MKFTLTSDLHLEFRNTQETISIADDINNIEAVVNIVAGDVHSNSLIFDYFTENLVNNCFFVKGNHDYYGNQLSNDVYRLEKDGIKILGCTLWTQMTDHIKQEFNTYMMDSRKIKHQKSLVDEISTINIHNFELIMDEQPDIVVTHHCPTTRSIHPMFAKNSANGCFSSDYEKYLKDTKIKYWCFGHTHWRHQYQIGNTRFLCNPLGYRNEIKEPYFPITFEI